MEIDWIQVVTVISALASGGVAGAVAIYIQNKTTKNALLVASKVIGTLLETIEESDAKKVKAKVNNRTKDDPESKKVIDDKLKEMGVLSKNPIL